MCLSMRFIYVIVKHLFNLIVKPLECVSEMYMLICLTVLSIIIKLSKFSRFKLFSIQNCVSTQLSKYALLVNSGKIYITIKIQKRIYFNFNLIKKSSELCLNAHKTVIVIISNTKKHFFFVIIAVKTYQAKQQNYVLLP